MKPVPEVIHCAVVGPTTVQLSFRDGWTGALNIGAALHGRMLKGLKPADKFRQVEIQDGTLVWPNGADICPSVLRYWCELGRVCSQKELDDHFDLDHPAVLVEAVAESKSSYRSKAGK